MAQSRAGRGRPAKRGELLSSTAIIKDPAMDRPADISSTLTADVDFSHLKETCKQSRWRKSAKRKGFGVVVCSLFQVIHVSFCSEKNQKNKRKLQMILNRRGAGASWTVTTDLAVGIIGGECLQYRADMFIFLHL